MKPFKKVTCTWQILDALVRADDFLTARQLQQRTGCNTCQTSAALIHLRRRKAVDCMESDGQLWWYATPETDDRTYSVDERTPEAKPRRRRRRKQT